MSGHLCLSGSDTSANLDSWPTSDRSHNPDRLATEYLSAEKLVEKDRWYEAIAADPLSLSHVVRYQNCGSNAWIQENIATGRCRIVHNTCKLRVCPLCSRIAARRVRSRLEAALHGSKLRKWRLITLTIRSEAIPLAQQIQNLRNAFKRLRKSSSWKANVEGGYAVLEVTYNADSGLWHPHFHVVAAGRYYPWQELKRDWMAASGGSQNTDIRPVRTTAGAIFYLTEYLGKLGSGVHAAPLERLTEFYRTIQGQRFLIPFGQAPSPAKPERSLALDDWRNVAPLWQYIVALRDGHIWAICLGKKLHRSPPDEFSIADHHPPPV